MVNQLYKVAIAAGFAVVFFVMMLSNNGGNERASLRNAIYSQLSSGTEKEYHMVTDQRIISHTKNTAGKAAAVPSPSKKKPIQDSKKNVASTSKPSTKTTQSPSGTTGFTIPLTSQPAVDFSLTDTSDDELDELSIFENYQACKGYCAEKIFSERELSHSDCSTTGMDRLKYAFQLENCNAALQSPRNANLVEKKLGKLAQYDVFVFFRGAASLFDFNMMCSDTEFTSKRLHMPRVTSNGDCHPENFGSMVMANGGLEWGVNDFDQSFNSPFTWDVKRGGSGIGLACFVHGWNDYICRAAVIAFVGEYVRTIVGNSYVNETSGEPQFVYPSLTNQDRFVEGSRATLAAPLINDVFQRARQSEQVDATIDWLENDFSIDLKTNKFTPSPTIVPLPDIAIPKFQAAIDAYLFNGVAALAIFPNDGWFYKVQSVARRSLPTGTGSIGVNRFLVLIQGRYSKYGRIILELKEEMPSMLETFFHYKYTSSMEGKRVVDSERGAYPYTNIFFGWVNIDGQSYIVNEKSKHQKNVKLDLLSAKQYLDYATLCGKALALYHMRAACADHICALDDPIAYDQETWSSVTRYILTYEDDGLDGFKNYLVQFSLNETRRQIESWNMLRTFVRTQQINNRPLIELLNYNSCPAGQNTDDHDSNDFDNIVGE